MARKASPPSYCHHKASGQAITRVNGRMIYLGEYDSRESRSKWAEIVTDWSAVNLDKYGNSVSVARLCVAFTKNGETYYLKNGEQTSHMHAIRSALQMLVTHFGQMTAERFLPCHLEQLQQHFLERGLTRYTINRYVNIVRQAFRFAVTKGNVPPAIWQGLLAVRNLQRGRSQARETSSVQPVQAVIYNELNPSL